MMISKNNVMLKSCFLSNKTYSITAREFNIILIIMKGFDLFFLGQHFKYFVFLLLKYSGRVIDQSIYSVTFTAIVSIM